MKKRKILFHINSIGKGGAEKVVSVLSRYFAEDGYDVVIVTLWRAGEEYVLSDKVKRVNLGDLTENARGGRLVLAIRRFTDLRRIIRKEKPDIVLSFCMKANFRSAYSMFGMKTPLMISVRSDPKVHYTPYKRDTGRMERKAAGCVFQTEDARAFFGKRLQEKSRIIWNPVDEKYLNIPTPKECTPKECTPKECTPKECVAQESVVQRDTQKEQGAQREKRRRIVTVGRISGEKNQLMLLKAFAGLKDRFPDTCVQIYGEEIDHKVKQELAAYSRENHMEERVMFMGPSNTLEKELPGAELFVLPSNYEGMSNALMEAMVMGLPVIATDCPCGGCAMMIADRISGLLVPVGDENALMEAMGRLLSDRDLAMSMGKKAGEIAEKVSPLKVYEEWKAYVEELINGRDRG